MAKQNVFALGRSDLNGFLFADVGPEANGMTLSVLSLLARAGADPWNEAERLAKLSAAMAIAWLSATIAAMPAKSWTGVDAEAIARRLVALLPPRNQTKV